MFFRDCTGQHETVDTMTVQDRTYGMWRTFMELCVDENSMVFQNEGFSERSAGETVMEAKKFTKEASQRLSLFEEEYERLWTVLTCGMAVMEARMTRTKRDVSVGIHSSSHGHEIMSDFASPGPLGTKQRALRLLFHMVAELKTGSRQSL